jgi:hypothetical protein
LGLIVLLDYHFHDLTLAGQWQVQNREL